jgi:hypothetical protein
MVIKAFGMFIGIIRPGWQETEQSSFLMAGGFEITGHVIRSLV